MTTGNALRALIQDDTTANARRAGLDRRAFLRTTCGAATALLAMNKLLGCARTGAGGGFAVPTAAALDEALATSIVGGEQLVIDVQTHPASDRGDGYSPERFIRQVFFESDTNVAVLSLPACVARRGARSMRGAAATFAAVDRLGKGPRIKLHAVVLPNAGPLEEQLDGMQAAAETGHVSAWKLYPGWGPRGAGYWLDDPSLGIPVIQRARDLGVRRICVHKGMPMADMDPTFTRCRDVGRVARMFPDVTFLIDHAGYEPNVTEGAYDPDRVSGVDGLIRSMDQYGIRPGANVYAELGSTWRLLMTRPTEAAHVLGKLLSRMGGERVLWGTDSIWYGSPQDQIVAFRAFEISEGLQARCFYPSLGPDLKALVLGVNAAEVYGIDPRAVRASLRSEEILAP